MSTSLPFLPLRSAARSSPAQASAGPRAVGDHAPPPPLPPLGASDDHDATLWLRCGRKFAPEKLRTSGCLQFLGRLNPGLPKLSSIASRMSPPPTTHPQTREMFEAKQLKAEKELASWREKTQELSTLVAVAGEARTIAVASLESLRTQVRVCGGVDVWTSRGLGWWLW
eukprot:356176-Chlamydomonas_euryale.AAC.5